MRSDIKRWLLLLAGMLFIVLFTRPISAYDQVIVNSGNWQDVYTGTQYADLYGIPNNFLVSTQDATILLYSIPTTRKSILVLSSTQRPFIVGYPDILRSRGYTQPEEIRSSNLNLELLKRLQNISRFIIVDDAYGYNAISVAPFAIVDRSFVIFANKDNIDNIVPILQTKNPTKVLIYGQVDREVKTGLAQFNPEILDKGDRFDNNIEIVTRYLAIKPTKQVVLTNGEFIEAGIMSGSDPVLFLGRQNVPASIQAFIKSSGIEVGILIGNELVNTATFVRRQLGISVFVKFAQGARQPTGAIATVEDLDRFPMPSYDLGLEVTGIVYNKATGSLEVTYHNTVGLAEYFKSTLTVHDGTAVKVTGDSAPVFLDKNEYKTVIYSADSDGNPLNLQSSTLTGDVFTVFGESGNSLEDTYQKSFQIDLIDILDDTQINITGLFYDKTAQQFFVRIKNTGKVDAYVSAELVNLVVNGQATTYGSDGVVKISAGDTQELPVTVQMVDADFQANPTVDVRAYYGERELSRIKIQEATFPIEFRTGIMKYALYGAAVAVILFLLLFLGTKKRCKHCGHKNARGRKTCINCGQKF